jgi:LPS-assembly protein|uniref:LPS assembly protein LptD n=1 Tax=Oleiagrimonas sp. TaxID=2010330 RepID=UPI00263960A1
VTCALGSLSCPPRPISYAMCRPNALLSFYQYGLPADARGRATAQTDIRAEHVDSASRTTYALDGRVRLQRYDQLLRAEHVDYNDLSTAYAARGNVRYQDSSLLLSARRMHGTTRPNRGVADHVRYQMLDSRGNGVAEQARLTDPQHSQFRQASYSTCDPDDRIWEFRASRISLNKKTGVGVARNATLRYHDIPFLYLPYVSFPIDNRRKTGLLYPTFGNSSNSGFMYSQPYYLNLAPNYDATLTPHLYTRRGTMLGSEFRYLSVLGRGQLNVDYMPHDRLAGNDHNGTKRATLDNGANRYFIDYRDSTRLSRQWNFTANYKRASDRYYFQDFSSDLSSTAPSVLASNAYISGAGQWWNAAIGVDRYQSVDPLLPDSSLQYRRWPRGVLRLDVPVSRIFDIGLDSEAVAFRKNNAVQGNRYDFQPYVQASLGGSAWFLDPRVSYRYTNYNLIDNYSSYGYTQQDPTRSMPIYSVDTGLFFERDTHLFGSHYTQTLEPRLYYLYVPYRNQYALPLFDTRPLTFDFWQLFSSNQYSGADRQMNANNLTGAITTRLLDDKGDQRASLSFGQIHYFAPQQVQLNPNIPVTRYTGSAYVSQLELQLSEKWRLTSAYQWSPNTRQSQLATVGVQRRIGGDGIFNFAYRFRRNFLEQIDVSTVYPISPRWRVLGRWNVSLRDQINAQTDPYWQRGHPKTLEALAGVEYDSCCVAVRLLGRHYVRDYQGHTNNAVILEIQFKGLGSSSPQTEEFLRRAILGYQ